MSKFILAALACLLASGPAGADLNVVVNTDVVAGYRLMLVNADGTETELSVGSGNGKSSFALNFANGAQIIHLVPIAE